ETHELARLTVLIVASGDDVEAAQSLGRNSLAELLDGVRAYFADHPIQRGSVKIALLVNDWDSAPPERWARALGEGIRGPGSRTEATPVPDAAVVISTGASAVDDRAAALFLNLRVLIDLFRSERFASALFAHAASHPRWLGLRVDEKQFDLAR